jgi:proteic killer suppression protein
MKIGNVRHRGLRRFIEKDDAAGLPAKFVEKIRNMISFLQEMERIGGVAEYPRLARSPIDGRQKRRMEPHGQPELAHYVSDR